MSIPHRYLQAPSEAPKPLTPRELALAHIIATFWRQHSFAPSMEELRITLGYSSRSSIHRLIVKLEQKGWLVPRQHHGSRQIKLHFDPNTHSAFSPAPYDKNTLGKRREMPVAKLKLAEELSVPNCQPREFMVRVLLLQAVQHFERIRPIKNGTYFAAKAREVMRQL